MLALLPCSIAARPLWRRWVDPGTVKNSDGSLLPSPRHWACGRARSPSPLSEPTPSVRGLEIVILVAPRADVVTRPGAVGHRDAELRALRAARETFAPTRSRTLRTRIDGVV